MSFLDKCKSFFEAVKNTFVFKASPKIFTSVPDISKQNAFSKIEEVENYPVDTNEIPNLISIIDVSKLSGNFVFMEPPVVKVVEENVKVPVVELVEVPEVLEVPVVEVPVVEVPEVLEVPVVEVPEVELVESIEMPATLDVRELDEPVKEHEVEVPEPVRDFEMPEMPMDFMEEETVFEKPTESNIEEEDLYNFSIPQENITPLLFQKSLIEDAPEPKPSKKKSKKKSTAKYQS